MCCHRERTFDASNSSAAQPCHPPVYQELCQRHVVHASVQKTKFRGSQQRMTQVNPSRSNGVGWVFCTSQRDVQELLIALHFLGRWITLKQHLIQGPMSPYVVTCPRPLAERSARQPDAQTDDSSAAKPVRVRLFPNVAQRHGLDRQNRTPQTSPTTRCARRASKYCVCSSAGVCIQLRWRYYRSPTCPIEPPAIRQAADPASH